jgi:hypothetical protein
MMLIQGHVREMLDTQTRFLAVRMGWSHVLVVQVFV